MDTLTHLVAGALTPLAFRATPKRAGIVVFGILAGELPDIDVFFGTGPASLLSLHRGITHALIWQPVLAILLTLPFFIWLCRPLRQCGGQCPPPLLATGNHIKLCSIGLQNEGIRGKMMRLLSLLPVCSQRASPVGIGLGTLGIMALFALYTHLYLDCMTTFGTQIFLPFSQARVALPGMFIIDFLILLPGAACLILALCQKADPVPFASEPCDRIAPWAIAGTAMTSGRARRFARIGLAWMLLYPLCSFGVNQAVALALTPMHASEPGSRLTLLTEPFSPFIWKAVVEEPNGREYRMGTLFLTKPSAVQWEDFARPNPPFVALLRRTVPFFDDFIRFCPTLVMTARTPQLQKIEGEEVAGSKVAETSGQGTVEYTFMDLRYIISSQSPARAVGRKDTNFIFEVRTREGQGPVAYRFLNRSKNQDTPWTPIQ